MYSIQFDFSTRIYVLSVYFFMLISPKTFQHWLTENHTDWCVYHHSLSPMIYYMVVARSVYINQSRQNEIRPIIIATTPAITIAAATIYNRCARVCCYIIWCVAIFVLFIISFYNTQYNFRKIFAARTCQSSFYIRPLPHIRSSTHTTAAIRRCQPNYGHSYQVFCSFGWTM